MPPESSRDVKLMNTVSEMREDRLNVLEDPNVVVPASVSFVILKLANNLRRLNFNFRSKSKTYQTHSIVQFSTEVFVRIKACATGAQDSQPNRGNHEQLLQH